MSSTSVGRLEEDRLSAILAAPDQEFSVAAYLNAALEKTTAGGSDVVGAEELTQRMAEVALQLQLQTQACHEEIGRIGAELQAVLPRCVADVGRIGVGLEGLRLDAAALLEDTIQVSTGSVDTASNKNKNQATAAEDGNTTPLGAKISEEEFSASSSLETLSTLHALQANLSRARDILLAAATWDTTLASLPPLLAQQNLPEAVEALAQLQRGERALRGMPNPEQRQEAMAKIKQQVSVLLQPQLQNALGHLPSRLAPLQQCVVLYAKLDKMDVLMQEYVKHRPTAVHKAWFDYSPSYQAASPDHPPTSHEAWPSQTEQFQAWLPTWFDAVLSLLNEERRQSLTIFGPEWVYQVVIKVLQECFRPILPSFQSRLESISSTNPSSPTQGSLEAICALYESTLQFLGLVYETISGGWLDMVEAGSIQGDAVALYRELMAVFLQVAAPFAPYQKNFAQLESKHLALQFQYLAKEASRAVAAMSASDLEALQESTEKLREFTCAGFPLLEGALARFELLNGGHGATATLSTFDKVLTGHANEMAIAIHSLSAAVTADTKRLSNSFDEQTVHCALDVLKVAGSFRRELRKIEGKTRERLSLLGQRISSHALREKEIGDAAVLGKAVSGQFHLPDALSLVEIDSAITKHVCEWSEEGDSFLLADALRKLAVGGIGVPALYSEADEAAKRLANSCHTFVFDVCSAVPRHHLQGMSSLSSWRADSGNEAISSYGTLPQSYITQVGEHMLALVQALEPFASDQDAIALANEVMADVREVALPYWRDFLNAAGSSDSQIARTLMDGKELSTFVLDVNEEGAVDDDEGNDEATGPSAVFCNAWLDVVGLAVSGHLLELVMRIPLLSRKGCEHLSADLNYLVNVFSALGIAGHPHPLLGHLAQILLTEREVLQQRISARDNHPINRAIVAVEQRVAEMRQVSPNF